MIIVLIGYMASGKSEVGKTLASKINYDFIDLDAYIERKEQSTIADIFSDKGEVYFRKLETKQLDAILKDHSKLVLALGGGTPCYGNNMNLILNHDQCISIYLKTSIQSIVHRLQNEKQHRPLIAHLKNTEQLTEFIGKHLLERLAFYEQAAIRIAVEKEDVLARLSEL